MTPESGGHSQGRRPSQGKTPYSRSASRSIIGKAELRSLASLPSFWKLPYELRTRIIILACGPPVLPCNTPVGRSIDCTSTMLSLLRATRIFYPTVIPLLYAHVRLPRPSNLRSFQRTLGSRPLLGRLVRSLHVGEDQPLPEHWYPVRSSGCNVEHHSLFRLNLGSAEGTASWIRCQVHEHQLDHFDRDDPKDAALHAALQTLSQDLNINFRRRRYNFFAQSLSSDEWYIRLFQLQSALEIYLLELQRRAKEARTKARRKKSKVDRHSSTRYPSLSVGIAPFLRARSTNSDRDGLKVSRSQLLERMTSPGAPTDSFNHPFLFARSGLAWQAVGPDGEHHRGSSPIQRNEDEVEQVARTFGMPHVDMGQEAIQLEGSIDVPESTADSVDLASPSTATIGGHLSTARHIFALTTNVEKLSVTGFFERAVVGQLPPLHQGLQSLTLGPCPTGWSLPLHLAHPALKSIERLRICGRLSAGEETRILAGQSGALERLSEVQWVMVEEYNRQDINVIVELIKQLVGLDPSSLARSSDAAAKEQQSRHGVKETREGGQDPEDDDDKVESALQLSAGRTTSFEAQLHPVDVAIILAAAPTEEVAEAWRQGKAVRGMQHRLKVVPRASNTSNFAPEPLWSNRGTRQAICDEGKRWWEGA